jgi:hypothetical protein
VSPERSFSESLSLVVRSHSHLSAKNFVSQSSHSGAVTAWVTSQKSFSPSFLLVQDIAGNPNLLSLSLESGQKGIVHMNTHAVA